VTGIISEAIDQSQTERRGERGKGQYSHRKNKKGPKNPQIQQIR
jgi:hypothetical protein